MVYKFKKYVRLFVVLIIIFLSFHIVIWNLYTKYVFPKNYEIGDLGRMSYKLDSLQIRQNNITLTKKHISFDQLDGKLIDILTIGDSFSNGGGGGKNSFYQDYLATMYKLNILHIQDVKPSNNYIETIYLLYNSGFFDKLKPKYIILESTECEVLNRFSVEMNNNIFLNYNQVNDLLVKTKYKSKKITPLFINNLNYNAFFYNIAYKFDDNAYYSNAYLTQLNQGFFNVKDSDTLLFYKNTINYNKSISTEKIEKLNTNLNNLAKILENKGIKLYFMPVVDKFNLYSKYLVANRYGHSTFFEQLRKMPKEYRLIDTKAILEKEIDNGEKDIFYADDTHWSYKASEAIAKDLKEFGDISNDKL